MSSQNESTPPTGAQSTPPETIKHKSSNVGLYVGVAIAVIALVVVGVGYEAGLFTKTTTKTVTECPSGDTGTYPNCVAPTGPTACAPAATSQTINAAGSTFVAPLMDQWETSFSVGSNVLDYQSVGSGTGISDLGTLAVPVAASDAPASYSQVQEYFKTNTILTIPESAGGAAVIYNLAGNWHSPLNLTAAVIAGIFTGTITNWDDSAIATLNPADTLPNQPIIVVHRSDGSGTSYMFQQFMQWDSGGVWNLNYSTTYLGPSSLTGEISAKGSSGVTAAVKSNVGAISYVDLEYALASGGLYTAAVENVKGNFIVPTIQDITSALTDKTSEAGFQLPAGNGNWSGLNLLNAPGSGDYPIASFTYLLIYEHPDVAFGSSAVMSQSIAEAIALWINWTISPNGGQQYSDSLYYVPLPAFVTAWDQQTLGMMDWGSSSIPACASGTGPVGYQY